jgi:CRP-like cAMP-binding protein
MSKSNLHFGKQFNFLKSLTLLERKTLEQHSKLIALKKGDVIFFENEHLEELYCIKKGICKFAFTDVNGKEHITKLLGKGDVMGRNAIISNNGALVTATALSNSELYTFKKDDFLNIITTNKDFCLDIVKGFISDTKEEVDQMRYFKNYRTVKVRLAGLLLYLKNKFGVQKEGWLNITLKREDIANLLGTTSEYVISLLTAFKEKKYLSVKREKIKIISIKKLELFSKTN